MSETIRVSLYIDVDFEDRVLEEVLEDVDVDDFIVDHKEEFTDVVELKEAFWEWVDTKIEENFNSDTIAEHIADEIDCGDFYDSIKEAIDDELPYPSTDDVAERLWDEYGPRLEACIGRRPYDHPREMHRFPVPTRFSRISRAIAQADSDYDERYGYASEPSRRKILARFHRGDN